MDEGTGAYHESVRTHVQEHRTIHMHMNQPNIYDDSLDRNRDFK